MPFAQAGAGLIPFTRPTEKTTMRPHPLLSVLPAALLLALPLSACGLGDSGSAAVTAAKLKASEAESARATKEKLEQQIAESQQQAAQRQKEIEAATR